MTSDPKARSAVIYTRISRDDKDREGNLIGMGVERQEFLCRDLAERLGWVVVAVYIDNNVSASRYAKKARLQYLRMIEDMKGGVAGAVIALDQDRIFRRNSDGEEFIDLVEQYGWNLVTTAGDIDLSTADGRATFRLRLTMSAHESEKKSERGKRQVAYAAHKGLPAMRGRSFGYELGSMQLRTEEAAALRDAVRAILHEGKTLGAVCREWNARGLLTVNGNEWQTTLLRSTLKSPKLAGLRVLRGDVVGEGVWPPVLDRGEWEQLCALLAARARPGRPARRLLSGILRCGHCGEAMVSGTVRERPTYRCMKGPGFKGCGRMSIREQSADRWVSDLVIKRIPEVQRPDPGGHMAPERAQLTAELRDTEDSLEQLARDYYADKRISGREFFAARDVLERRAGEARARLAALSRRAALQGVPREPAELAQWWAAQPVEVLRPIVQDLIDSITIYPHPPTKSRVFDPERIGDPAWKV